MKTTNLGKEVGKDNTPRHVRLLANIAWMALENEATDIYIRRDSRSVYRSCGDLHFVDEEWLDGENKAIFENGILPAMVFDEMRKYLQEKAGAPDNVSWTAVFQFAKGQVRLHHSPHIEPVQIHARLQPLTPYPLASYFPDRGLDNPTVQVLREASGLIIVTGPIGAGKTTLAQAIVGEWARPRDRDPKNSGKLGKHVMLIADPIEYKFENPDIIHSEIECVLTSSGKSHGKPFITDVIPDVLRSDIDALFIGEVRDPVGLSACMNFAATKEPIITTLHAASIADCVIRMISMAEQVMSPAAAKLVLGACIEGILFVNVVYNAEGVAVPLVEYLPIGPTIRKAMSEDDPVKLTTTIDKVLKNGDPLMHKGLINRQATMKVANKSNLTEANVIQAMGRLTE